MTEEIKNKILEKIRKLMNKQKSAESIGNLEEAAIFAAKISELLTKYNLSKFEIGKGKEKSDIKDRFFDHIKPAKNEGKWVYALYNLLCRYNYCTLISVYTKHIDNGSYKTVYTGATIFGSPENIEIVIFLADQLKEKIKFLSKGAWDKVKNQPHEKRNSFLRAYYKGAVSGISYQLSTQRKEQMKNSNITDLVLFNKEALKKAVDDKYEKVTKERLSDSRKETSGGYMGYIDGKNVGINKGLGDNVQKNKLN